MQKFCSAVVLLLGMTLCVYPQTALAKTHTVIMGAGRKVPYTPPEANPDNKSEEATTLRIRPLLVDGIQKEWTVGDTHEVTDRTFVIRRALHINDALPSEKARWSWQPGPWLMVDRMTGRVTALHLPDFDPEVSEVVWFRDYAAYCGVSTTAKGGLVAVVTEIGARKAVVQKVIASWPQTGPQTESPHPACATPQWQRTPMRATLQPSGGNAVTFDVVGTFSLIEEGEEADPQP